MATVGEVFLGFNIINQLHCVYRWLNFHMLDFSRLYWTKAHARLKQNYIE